MKIGLNEVMIKDGIPVIPAKIEGNPINLLIDSGANVSYLNNKIFRPNDHIVNTFQTYGIGGIIESCSCMYKTRIGAFCDDVEFALNDLSESMDAYSNMYGVKIDGLLGSDFLAKYKCHIDFENLSLII